jgi:hypothetical protein
MGPRAVCKFWRRGKSCAPAGIQIPANPTRSPVITPTALSLTPSSLAE